jgi:hypothetical protein
LDYKPVLCARFEQLEIYIASHPVEII